MESFRKNFARVVVFVSVLLVAYWFWRCWMKSPVRIDLEILTTAASRLREGTSTYRLSDHAEHTKPPLVTWIMQWGVLFPAALTRLIWDLLAFTALLGLGIRWLGRRFSWGILCTGWLLSYGPWLAEARLGQYNMLLSALAFASAQAEADKPSRWRTGLLGAVLVLEVLFKPTQLVVVPWMVSGMLSKPRRLATALGGAALLVALLSLGFSWQFGWGPFVEAHSEWLAFLPQSTTKHFLRPDNLGLPTLLARVGEFGPGFSSALLAGGVAVSGFLSLRSPLSRQAFFWCSVLATVLSPMAWRQNYSVLFVLLSWAVLEKHERSSEWLSLKFALIPLILFQLLTTDLLGVDGYLAFASWGGPLALFLWAAFLGRRAFLPESSAGAMRR
jgi:hypothetical protein